MFNASVGSASARWLETKCFATAWTLKPAKMIGHGCELSVGTSGFPVCLFLLPLTSGVSDTKFVNFKCLPILGHVEEVKTQPFPPSLLLLIASCAILTYHV